MIPAPGFPLPWPLPVTFLPCPLQQGSWWRYSQCVGYLLAVLWWWLIRQRLSRLDLGRKQRSHLHCHHCSQRHPFCFLCGAGFGDQQCTHSKCLEKMSWKSLQDQERQNINVVVFSSLIPHLLCLQVSCCILSLGELFAVWAELFVHIVRKGRFIIILEVYLKNMCHCIPGSNRASSLMVWVLCFFSPFHLFCPLFNIASLLLKVADSLSLAMCSNFLFRSFHSPFPQVVRSQAR